jgi:hypothetical protein
MDRIMTMAWRSTMITEAIRTVRVVVRSATPQ